MTLINDHTPRAARVEATVTWLADTYAIATDEFGVRYFLLPTHIEWSSVLMFTDLMVGSIVQGLPIDHPKGLRLLEIVIVRA